MRKFYALFLFVLFISSTTFSQNVGDYRTVTGGFWGAPIWEKCLVAGSYDNAGGSNYSGPTSISSGETVTINHLVAISSGVAGASNAYVVTNDGNILINGVTFYIGHTGGGFPPAQHFGALSGSGDIELLSGSDLSINNGSITIDVGGTFKESGGNMNSPFNGFTVNGTYEYAETGGTLPVGLSWGNSSLLLVSGSGQLAEGTSTTVNDLTIGASGKLTVSATSDLTVSGSLTNTNNANLVIKSTSAGTGSLICDNSSPNATIERYVSSDAWHLLGPPVVGADVNPTFYTGYMQIHDEATSTWAAFEGASHVMTRGDGDAFYFVSSDFTATYTGQLQGGALTKGSLGNTLNDGTKGWHCLSNPFPSAITWSDCSRANVGIAQVYNGSSYGAAAVIPAQQGFMVQVDDNKTGSVTFTTAAKTHDAETFYKNDSPWGDALVLKLSDNMGISNDQLIVQINDNATLEFDTEYDARKIEGSAKAGEFFAHISDNDFASMIGVPLYEEVLTIPVGFKKGDDVEYTIELSDNSLSNNIGVALEDLETGQVVNLKEQSVYTFTSSGNNNNRFNLVFSNATGLDEDIVQNNINIWNVVDEVYIQSNEKTPYDIFVYSVSGKLVKSVRNLTNESSSFTLNAPKGAYIIKYMSEGKVFSQKIIK